MFCDFLSQITCLVLILVSLFRYLGVTGKARNSAANSEMVEGTLTLVDLAGSEHRIDSMWVLLLRCVLLFVLLCCCCVLTCTLIMFWGAVMGETAAMLCICNVACAFLWFCSKQWLFICWSSSTHISHSHVSGITARSVARKLATSTPRWWLWKVCLCLYFLFTCVLCACFILVCD